MQRGNADSFIELFSDDPLFLRVNDIPDLDIVDSVLSLDNAVQCAEPRNAEVDHAFCDSLLVAQQEERPKVAAVQKTSYSKPIPNYYVLKECEASRAVSGVPNLTALPSFEIPEDLKETLRKGSYGRKQRTKDETEKLVNKLVHAAEDCALRRKLEARALIKNMNPTGLRNPSAKKRCAERSRIEARVTRVSNNLRSANLKACVRWLVHNLYFSDLKKSHKTQI